MSGFNIQLLGIKMNVNKLENILKLFLDKTYSQSQERNFEYLVCGSMSTYLQGCDIQPNDVDILVKDAEGVSFFAELMSEYAVQKTPSDSVDDWLSTVDKPVFTIISEDGKEQWYMARWMIDGMKFEIAHLVSEESLRRTREKSCIWENGPDMYPHIKKIDFHGYQLGVIPLEIQLSTNMFRSIEERVSEILKILKKEGYDNELLKRALTAEQYASIIEKLEH
ncbi:MAG: hypothetical protein BAJATHORv1_80038 [Candidatus Thorarchaeota archaeon]|nr:MAG: hypothetical protein BAJATHORv1_80038 [Candidatus Thorarchaeota archaeon]